MMNIMEIPMTFNDIHNELLVLAEEFKAANDDIAWFSISIEVSNSYNYSGNKLKKEFIIYIKRRGDGAKGGNVISGNLNDDNLKGEDADDGLHKLLQHKRFKEYNVHYLIED